MRNVNQTSVLRRRKLIKRASCKNHTRLNIRVHKPYPISDQNSQNQCPISDQKGSKTIPFGAALTYIAYIGEYTLPPPHPPRGRARESQFLRTKSARVLQPSEHLFRISRYTHIYSTRFAGLKLRFCLQGKKAFVKQVWERGC